MIRQALELELVNYLQKNSFLPPQNPGDKVIRMDFRMSSPRESADMHEAHPVMIPGIRYNKCSKRDII